MLKKINCYLLVFLLLLVGCLEPDVSDNAKSQNKDTQVEQKQEEEKITNTPQYARKGSCSSHTRHKRNTRHH